MTGDLKAGITSGELGQGLQRPSQPVAAGWCSLAVLALVHALTGIAEAAAT